MPLQCANVLDFFQNCMIMRLTKILETELSMQKNKFPEIEKNY